MHKLTNEKLVEAVEMGKRMHLARMKMSVSQKELAQLMGVSQSMINKYEMGINRVPPDALAKLSKALDTPVSYFYGEEDSPENVRTILQNYIEESKRMYSHSFESAHIPLLDELNPVEIVNQISNASKYYVISSNIADEKDGCFAIRTTSLNSIDIDIAIDTTIVVSTTMTPINGDKVLLYHEEEFIIRTCFKRDTKLQFFSANPSFSDQYFPVSENDIIVGVIILIEKRF